MNSKHAFLALSVFTLVSIAHGEREVFAPTKLAPVATAANGNITFSNTNPFWTGANISATTNFGIGPTTANILTFHTNGAERMRFTSTGNVFVGNGETAASVANGNIRATGGSGTNINGADLVLHGGQSTGTASGGALRFFTAPAGGVSGTSVNASTERMRIDSAGLVGIGTTPSVLLDVLNPSAAASPEVARFRSDTAATPYVSFFNGASRTGIIQYSATNLFLQADANKGIQITTTGTGVLTQSTGGSERFRIDSSGNVGIGTNTNLSTLTINGPIAPKGPTDVNAATYTVQTTDSSLRFTTTNCTVTLPAAASFPGRILWLNTVTANSVTSNASNVIPLGSNTAGTAIFAATAGKFAMIQSNGTNWVTMMSN